MRKVCEKSQQQFVMEVKIQIEDTGSSTETVFSLHVLLLFQNIWNSPKIIA